MQPTTPANYRLKRKVILDRIVFSFAKIRMRRGTIRHLPALTLPLLHILSQGGPPLPVPAASLPLSLQPTPGIQEQPSAFSRLPLTERAAMSSSGPLKPKESIGLLAGYVARQLQSQEPRQSGSGPGNPAWDRRPAG